MKDMIDYAQDFWYGPTGDSDVSIGEILSLRLASVFNWKVFCFLSQSFGNSFSQSKDSASEMEEENQVGDTGFSEGLPFSSTSMENDPRLAQLAIHAARSLHQLQGVRYDDSVAIDMVTDVKISIVELKLPLGCKFEISCMTAIHWTIIYPHSLSIELYSISVIFLENDGKQFSFVWAEPILVPSAHALLSSSAIS
jgi:hypothetical protein